MYAPGSSKDYETSLGDVVALCRRSTASDSLNETRIQKLLS